MNTSNFLTTIALSAGATYLLDPDRGRRRRALVRDKAVRAKHKLTEATDKTRRDLTNRLRGVVAGSAGWLNGEADDGVLQERVRAQLGRYVSHPGAIEVGVHDGVAILSGPVLQGEVENAIRATRHARGICDVRNHLEVHDEPGNIPALQGDSLKGEPRVELAQDNWSPAARFLVGSAGAAFLIRGFLRGGFIGWSTALFGTAILSRALLNNSK